MPFLEKRKKLEGFIIGDDRITMSQLQFADDTILFLKANLENIKRVELCMKIFQAISGLKINLFKTNMVGIEVKESCLSRFVEVMGCFVGRWPIKYLGMPLGGNPKAMAF